MKDGSKRPKHGQPTFHSRHGQHYRFTTNRYLDAVLQGKCKLCLCNISVLCIAYELFIFLTAVLLLQPTFLSILN